jgi:hypothetical protein
VEQNGLVLGAYSATRRERGAMSHEEKLDRGNDTAGREPNLPARDCREGVGLRMTSLAKGCCKSRLSGLNR